MPACWPLLRGVALWVPPWTLFYLFADGPLRALSAPLYLASFLPLMALNLGLLGFLGANFGSIAMQPFATIAGAASSVQAFFRMFGAAMVGLLIGQFYDGTARPFALALLICSTLALGFVLYSERGVLFRRLNVKPPKERIIP